MARKQSQDSHYSYLDGVKVKISEQYKPPRRITLVASYPQRLMLNKQILDNMPAYDFALEESVQNKMKEWRSARSALAEERRIRFEKCKEEKRKMEEQRLKKESDVPITIEKDEINAVDNTTSVHKNSYDLIGRMNPVYISSSTNSAMLLPTQVSTPYSNILMPTQLTNLPSNKEHIPKSTDKSPFNLSDFEADTSSPFDNMELKTLNDMEELAQVLKNDDTTKKNQNYSYSMQHNQYYQSFQDPMASYTYGSQQVANMNKSPYVQQQTSYAGTNGFYQPTNNLYNNTYAIPRERPDVEMNNRLPNASTHITEPRSVYNAVPDIIQSLESQLKHSHISSKPYVDNKLSPTTNHIGGNNKKPVDSLEDPFTSLSHEMQRLSQSISSMGFPLPRVARACKVIGNDKKKIVEHLLVMTELLDLGFTESEISKALIDCDNDRDKALDVLIL